MKQLGSRFTWLALLGIVIFAWVTRVYRLSLPAEYVFDETYHVPAIRLIANNDPRAFEWWHGPIYGNDTHDWLHPPLAKYIQAQFLTAYGQDIFAWRLASAVFGVLGIGLVFVVAQLAFKKTAVSLLAALLLSLDGLWLVQSRVAMNDVFVTVWLLAAAASYLWYRQRRRSELLLLVGLFGGLGLATKWSAAFWLAGLLIWEVLAVLRERLGKKIPWVAFSLIGLPLAVYILSFVPLLLQGKNFTYLVDLHKQIVQYEIYRGSSHPYQSAPWQWLFNLRPVWYWSGGENQQIYAINNPLLAWLEAGAVVFAVLQLFKSRKSQKVQPLDFVIMLFAVSFLPWLASPRPLFYYHFTPAVPLAALLLAYWLQAIYGRGRQPLTRALLFVGLASLVWVFWLYYPRWVGLPVSAEFSQAVYEILPGWR